ncbi:MAG: RHS repeat-associated core domain-containing protein, partial [Pirellula sp.]
RRLTQIVQTGQSGSSPVVDKRVSFEYNTQGLRSKLSRFESTSSAHPVATTDYLYDSTKRLEWIIHKQGTTNLNTYSLIYDDMHRITSITSTLDGKVDFDYDKRSQLTSVIDTTAGGGYNDVSQTLAYDQRGNRTGTGYTVNSDNRLTAAPNGVGMTYDNEGNLKTVTSNGSPQKRFEWDHRNRLTRVSIGNADWVTYEYDAFNRMVKRTQSGTFNTTYFAYDEGINPQLQWESNDSRLSLSHRYLWSDSVDELLADEQFLAGMTAPNTKWALSDHQGTIKDIVDYNPATGIATVDRHRKYDPFGDRRGAALPTDIVFGYTGKYFDDVTGLQNNWNRWYDPKQGRFISQDPIGFAGGDENLYRYVGNDVTNATDPSGLKAEGHHWIPISVLRGYYNKGLISLKDYQYFAGRTSGPLTGGHSWDADHKIYNAHVKEQMQKWIDYNKAARKKISRNQFADYMRDGKSFDGTPSTNDYNKRRVTPSMSTDKKVIKSFDGGLDWEIEARGATSIANRDKARMSRLLNSALNSKHARTSGLVGAIAFVGSFIGVAQDTVSAAEVLTSSKAIEEARKAAERGRMADMERWLIGNGFPERSVYEEFIDINPLAALAFRDSVEFSIKLYTDGLYEDWEDEDAPINR